MATAFVNGQRVGALGRSIRDAQDMLDGIHPKSVLFGADRSNHKIQSFYLNISGSDSTAVTIDRHGWAILFDDRDIGSVLLRPTPQLYTWAESMFQKVATEYGLRPCDFQAITWVVWRKNDRARRLSVMQLPLDEVVGIDVSRGDL